MILSRYSQIKIVSKGIYTAKSKINVTYNKSEV